MATLAKHSLRYSARSGDMRSVQRLLRRGADVNEQLNDGWTALMFAADKQNDDGLAICTALVNAHCKLDLRNWLGQTALMIAIDSGSVDVVELLLRNAANIHILDRHSASALHHASKRGLSRVVSMLLSRGADVRAHSGTLGKTPLHYAILGAGSSGGSVECVKVLLKAGSDLSSVDSMGNTPAHAAATAVGQEADRIALELVQAGADLYLRNEDGLTVPEAARRGGHAARGAAMLRAFKWRARWPLMRMMQLLARGMAEDQAGAEGPRARLDKSSHHGHAAVGIAGPSSYAVPSSGSRVEAGSMAGPIWGHLAHRPDLLKRVLQFL